MPHQRAIQTKMLIDIIQVVQRVQRTGTLVAERASGEALEQAVVTFKEGQVIQASVGSRDGSEALSCLSTWTDCQYTFVPSSPKVDTSSRPLRPIMAQEGGKRNGSLHTRTPRTWKVDLRKPPPATSVTGTKTQQLVDDRGEKNPQVESSTPVAVRTASLDKALPIIECQRLSRAHKQLFLLIDGQRTIADLARLTTNSQEEVSERLYDLEFIAVIQMLT